MVVTYADQLKAKLGDACTCCGAKDDLQLDHRFGGGRKHRAEIKRHGGEPFYRQVVEEASYDLYEWQCGPCNRSKGNGEACTLEHTTMQPMENQGDSWTQTSSNGITIKKGQPVVLPDEKRVKVTLSVLEDTDTYLRKEGPGKMGRVADELVRQAQGNATTEHQDMMVCLQAIATRQEELNVLVRTLATSTVQTSSESSIGTPWGEDDDNGSAESEMLKKYDHFFYYGTSIVLAIILVLIFILYMVA